MKAEKNSGYYRIGEVSKITGISKDTLHFYSKSGLVVPEFVNPENGYRYYSRENMWQLDIVMTCRKLNIPLQKVRQLLAMGSNEKIVELLMEYREEALRLSDYYRQVAEDLTWYREENKRILACRDNCVIERKTLAAEHVIIGSTARERSSYHVNLQEVVKNVLDQTPSIRKKYGYILDLERMSEKEFVKNREYLKLDESAWNRVSPEYRYTIPSGEYAVFLLHIHDEKADFSSLFQWLDENGEKTDIVFAEEMGLQLFNYIPDYYCEIKAHLKTQKGLHREHTG